MIAAHEPPVAASILDCVVPWWDADPRWRRVPPRVRRALLGGATAGRGEWPTADYYEDILQDVIAGLLRAGYSSQDVGALLHISPLTAHVPTAQGVGLTDLLTQAEARVQEQDRPGPFTIGRVVRQQEARGWVWWVPVRRDDAREGFIRLGATELQSERRFQAACLRDLGWPLPLRPRYAGKRFDAFVRLIVDSAVAELRPPDAVLADAICALVAAHGGSYRDTPTALLNQLTARAEREGSLPLEWPQSAGGMTYQLRRLTPHLRACGIRWCRARDSGARSQGQRTRRIVLQMEPSLVTPAIQR